MQKIIGVTELQRRFRSVLDDVVQQRVPYVLLRGSRPEAVMIPYEQFLRYQQLDRRALRDRFDAMLERLDALNEGYSEEEVAADIAAAIAEVRAEKRR